MTKKFLSSGHQTDWTCKDLLGVLGDTLQCYNGDCLMCTVCKQLFVKEATVENGGSTTSVLPCTSYYTAVSGRWRQIFTSKILQLDDNNQHEVTKQQKQEWRYSFHSESWHQQLTTQECYPFREHRTTTFIWSIHHKNIILGTSSRMEFQHAEIKISHHSDNFYKENG